MLIIIDGVELPELPPQFFWTANGELWAKITRYRKPVILRVLCWPIILDILTQEGRLFVLTGREWHSTRGWRIFRLTSYALLNFGFKGFAFHYADPKIPISLFNDLMRGFERWFCHRLLQPPD